jgi:hypothetical protein
MPPKTLREKNQANHEWYVVTSGFCCLNHGDVYPGDVIDLDPNYARTQEDIHRLRPLTEDEYEELKPQRQEGKKFSLAFGTKKKAEPAKTDGGGKDPAGGKGGK